MNVKLNLRVFNLTENKIGYKDGVSPKGIIMKSITYSIEEKWNLLKVDLDFEYPISVNTTNSVKGFVIYKITNVSLPDIELTKLIPAALNDSIPQFLLPKSHPQISEDSTYLIPDILENTLKKEVYEFDQDTLYGHPIFSVSID